MLPNEISGLLLWLKASSITDSIDTKVQTWLDSSTNANNAVQITESDRPTIVESDFYGSKAVRFGAGNNLKLTSNIATARSIFILNNYTGSVDTAPILGSENVFDFYGTASGSPVLNATYTNASILNGSVFENGVSISPLSLQKTSAYTLKEFITTGNVQFSNIAKDRTNVSRTWQGDYIEIIAFDRVLTSSERISIENYIEHTYSNIGKGTESEPYLITAKRISTIQSLPSWNTSYFKATENIDIDEDFEPIGTVDIPFSGHFDFDGFSINAVNSGLFGFISGATVTNMKASCMLEDTSEFTGIIKHAVNSTVSRIEVSGMVSGVQFVGGLIGHATGTTITKCSSLANVMATGDYAGGLFGYVSNCNVSDCYSKGRITSANYSGGVAGATINSCSFSTTYTSSVINCQGIKSGFAFNIDNSALSSNCFWDTSTSGIITGNVGLPVQHAKLTREITFTGYSFGTVWRLLEGDTPHLIGVSSKPGIVPLTGNMNFDLHSYSPPPGNICNFELFSIYTPPLLDPGTTKKSYLYVVETEEPTITSITVGGKYYNVENILQDFDYAEYDGGDAVQHDFGGLILNGYDIPYYFMASGISTDANADIYEDYKGLSTRTITVPNNGIKNVCFLYTDSKTGPTAIAYMYLKGIKIGLADTNDSMLLTNAIRVQVNGKIVAADVVDTSSPDAGPLIIALNGKSVAYRKYE